MIESADIRQSNQAEKVHLGFPRKVGLAVQEWSGSLVFEPVHARLRYRRGLHVSVRGLEKLAYSEPSDYLAWRFPAIPSEVARARRLVVCDLKHS